MASGTGYLYVRNWDQFQHYKKRNPPWIKLYVDLLHDDDYLALDPADRCLLQTVWMLSARHGNGRVRADQRALMAASNLSHGQRSRNLERLIQAGFLELRASKALAPRYHQSTEDSGVPPLSSVQRQRRASTSASTQHLSSSENGAQPHAGDDPEDKPLTKAEARRALAAIKAKALHPLDPDDEEL